MKFKNHKLFEAYVRNITREIITEKVSAKDRARNKTLDVIKNFFNNGSWLYGEYENESANPEHLDVLEYIEYSLIHTFFHSNNPDAVIRLEPMVCRLALRLGFEQLHPNRPKLNRLKKIVRFIKNNFRKEGFPIVLNEINIDTTTFNDLNSIFGKYIDDEMSSDNQNANNFKDETNRNHRYKVLPNIDYNTAHSYEKYTCSKSPMCFTEDKGTWDQYTNGDDYAVYLLLRDDWETVEEVHGENTPYDDYGLSMIFVIIDEEGNISSSNTRWNHELGDGHMPGDVDSAFTKTQLSELLGVNFNSVFKPKTVNDASSFEDECRRYAEEKAEELAKKEAEEKAKEIMETYKEEHMEEYLENYGVSEEEFEEEYEKQIEQIIQDMIPDIKQRLVRDGFIERYIDDAYNRLIATGANRTDEAILRLKINNFVNEAIRRYTKKADL